MVVRARLSQKALITLLVIVCSYMPIVRGIGLTRFAAAKPIPDSGANYARSYGLGATDSVTIVVDAIYIDADLIPGGPPRDVVIQLRNISADDIDNVEVEIDWSPDVATITNRRQEIGLIRSGRTEDVVFSASIDADFAGYMQFTVEIRVNNYLINTESFRHYFGMRTQYVVHWIVNDDNRNDIAEPGEDVELQVERWNPTDERARDVEVLLDTADTDVISITAREGDYGDISAGDSERSFREFEFTIANADNITGVSTNLTATRLEQSGSNWIPDAFIGGTLNPNTTSGDPQYQFNIVDNGVNWIDVSSGLDMLDPDNDGIDATDPHTGDPFLITIDGNTFDLEGRTVGFTLDVNEDGVIGQETFTMRVGGKIRYLPPRGFAELKSAISDRTGLGSRNNGNGIPEPGEVIEISITLINISDDNIDDVEAKLDEDERDVRVIDDRKLFGRIRRNGDTETMVYTFEIETDFEGRKITFNLDIDSELGYMGRDVFIIPVWKPELPEVHSLLSRYAPVLYLHHEEQFYPWGIYSMLDNCDLKNHIEIFNPRPEDLTSHNREEYYLDLRGVTPYLNVPDPRMWEGYPFIIYGRQMEPEEHPSVIALQYWFFYPFNDWHNNHEGEWEMAQIIYSRKAEYPILLTTAHHEGGTTYIWDIEVSVIEEMHPRIFIGRGSHSSWGTNGTHHIGIFDDVTAENGTALHPNNVNPLSIEGTAVTEPYTLIDITDEPGWPHWLGKWGQQSLIPESSGPVSPGLQLKNDINVWEHPVEWALDPSPSWYTAMVASPANLHVYDSYNNHVGLLEDGKVEATIPGTYFYVPSSYNEMSKELLWINTSEDLRFVIEATGLGDFDFVFARYLKAGGTTVKATYENVQITEDTVAIVHVSPENPNLIMEIDLDGDGSVDRIQQPTETTNALNIPLKLGWNLVSLALQPPSTDPGAVLNSINGQYNSIWACDPDTGWSVYMPNGPSTLAEMERGKGYWIEMNRSGTLVIQGTDPGPEPIYLRGGKWNLVGHNSLLPQPIGNIAPSMPDGTCVYTYDSEEESWLEYFNTGPSSLNDLEFLEPGRGYWFYVEEDWTINY